MLLRTSIPLCAVLLSGCVTPKVVHLYDEKCQVMTRRMELTVEKVQALDACSNAECAAQVLGGAISLTTSAIVSGSIALAGNVAFGHKLATRAIAKGDTILKYGKVIGQATQAIGLGEHVHTHNVEALRARGDRKETK